MSTDLYLHTNAAPTDIVLRTSAPSSSSLPTSYIAVVGTPATTSRVGLRLKLTLWTRSETSTPLPVVMGAVSTIRNTSATTAVAASVTTTAIGATRSRSNAHLDYRATASDPDEELLIMVASCHRRGVRT